MNKNWIKLNRKLMKTAFYKKDHEKVFFWIHLLMRANWEPTKEYLAGKPIVCQPGQFTTGRRQLAEETGISESKIERLLTFFDESEHQIKQQKTNTNRLITITNWSQYQINEQQIEQQSNNDRTTTEQRPNTLEEYKEDKELKEEGQNFYLKTEEEKEREKKYLQDIEDKRKKLLEKILAEESD